MLSKILLEPQKACMCSHPKISQVMLCTAAANPVGLYKVLAHALFSGLSFQHTKWEEPCKSDCVMDGLCKHCNGSLACTAGSTW